MADAAARLVFKDAPTWKEITMHPNLFPNWLRFIRICLQGGEEIPLRTRQDAGTGAHCPNPGRGRVWHNVRDRWNRVALARLAGQNPACDRLAAPSWAG